METFFWNFITSVIPSHIYETSKLWSASLRGTNAFEHYFRLYFSILYNITIITIPSLSISNEWFCSKSSLKIIRQHTFFHIFWELSILACYICFISICFNTNAFFWQILLYMGTRISRHHYKTNKNEIFVWNIQVKGRR